MEKLTRTEELLRCGFSRVHSAEMLASITEKEALAIYKDPMLRYGIDCGNPFKEEEVTEFILNHIRDLRRLGTYHTS